METQQKTTRADHVVAYIHRLIRDRNLSPGDALPTERDISQTLGVSRGPVREGMGRLRALGLIEARTKAGARLIETCPKRLLSEVIPALAQTEEQMVDLTEFREVIEVGAAILAAKRRTDENLENIGRILKASQRHIEEDEEEAFYETDKEFHLAILDGSHNNLLIATGSVIGDFVVSASDFPVNVTGEQKLAAMVDAQSEHEQIFRAIRLRDGSAAGALMRMHLQLILDMAGINSELPQAAP